MNPVILGIDLDEWYHARWASGSKKARWENKAALFKDYYHADRPGGEIVRPTRLILRQLREFKVKATFFILGEIAEWYPHLVREIAAEGHEIACHGMHHEDLALSDRKTFEKELAQSRKILEKLANQKVIGFRAPNLVVTDWLFEVLIDQGFQYDSSICPGRSIQGKYQGQAGLPSNPYRIGKLIEIPIPTFPVLKLPGAVSIASRIFGLWWTEITLEAALKTGAASFYAHPYEFNRAPKLAHLKLKERIFLRRMGKPMEEIFRKFLVRYHKRIMTAKGYLAERTIKN